MEVSRWRMTALVGLLLPLGWLVGTVGQQKSAAQPAPGDPVAQVGARRLTLAELDEKALAVDAGAFEGMRLSQAVYEARRQTLDAWVTDQVLEEEAALRGIDKETLIETEVRAHVGEVTETEAEAWFKANPDRVQQATLDQVRDPIKNLLQQERLQAAVGFFVENIRRTMTVTVNLEPPRLEVRVAANDPFRGPEDAPIQVVEFSDFQ